MKKVFLAAVCCMSVLVMQAKEMRFNVTYNEVTCTRGELYQYSQRYLGTTDVVITDGTYYELKNITPVMLCSDSTCKAAVANNRAKTTPNKGLLLPLSEETLMATNLAKKAECVAKQIYRIRETRMNILAGDVEHAPADGKAMQLVLKELDQQERELTAMFIGQKKSHLMHTIVAVEVDDNALNVKQTLCRFSKQNGLSDAKDTNGDAVMMDLQRTNRQVLSAEQPKKKGELIYVNQVCNSWLRILYNNKTVYEKVFSL